MNRYDLTDFEWNMIEPLLPNKPRGVPRVDDRRLLNGIAAAQKCATHVSFPPMDAIENPFKLP